MNETSDKGRRRFSPFQNSKRESDISMRAMKERERAEVERGKYSVCHGREERS
jgi:hypothetical protein